jgi:hypothetical protein
MRQAELAPGKHVVRAVNRLVNATQTTTVQVQSGKRGAISINLITGAVANH